jgi:hypothetical protein
VAARYTARQATVPEAEVDMGFALKAIKLIDVHGMNALIEPLVFGLMALDRLLVLAPFVRMAGVQRLAHPFEHLYQ